MAKYEYKVLASNELEESEESELNRCGADGWELVSVITTPQTYREETDADYPDDAETYTEYVETYYFKRVITVAPAGNSVSGE